MTNFSYIMDSKHSSYRVTHMVITQCNMIRLSTQCFYSLFLEISSQILRFVDYDYNAVFIIG